MTAMQNHAKAVIHLDKALQLELPLQDRRALERVRNRLNLPMWVVIGAIPGDSVDAKAKAAQVTRHTITRWRTGRTRPDAEQAKVLEGLTGYAAAEIHGGLVELK